MKTLILTGSDKGSDNRMHELLDLTIPSKQKYASIHEYDFLSLRSFPSDHECGFDSKKHVGYLRANIAFKMLRFYDAVMWIDGDSIVTNFDYKIEDFQKDDTCFTASYDWMHNFTFSAGNFVIYKNNKTQLLYNYFLALATQRIKNGDPGDQEQGTLNALWLRIPEVSNLFNILPHRFLGGVPAFITQTPSWIERKNDNVGKIISPWNKTNFLAHLTGISNHDRINIIKNNMLEL
jgi:hypothetical protein